MRAFLMLYVSDVETDDIDDDPRPGRSRSSERRAFTVVDVSVLGLASHSDGLAWLTNWSVGQASADQAHST